MGQSTLQQTIKLTTMKLLLFVALAIAAVSSLRPNLIHGMVTAIVDITDTHTDTDMDTTEERDLPMLNQKLMLKPSHGTDMVDITVMDIHTDMVATDIAI